MNKNKIISLAVGLSLFTASTTVFANTITTDTTSSSAITLEKTSPIIVLDVTDENKTQFLADLGLTSDEFDALSLSKGRGHGHGKGINDGTKPELTEEQKAEIDARREAKREARAELTEEQKAKMKANKGTKKLCLFQDDIDTLTDATGMDEDSLLALLKAYDASK